MEPVPVVRGPGAKRPRATVQDGRGARGRGSGRTTVSRTGDPTISRPHPSKHVCNTQGPSLLPESDVSNAQPLRANGYSSLEQGSDGGSLPPRPQGRSRGSAWPPRGRAGGSPLGPGTPQGPPPPPVSGRAAGSHW